MCAQTRTTGSLVHLNIGDKYQPAEVTFADGTKQSGFINGFIENNFIDFGGTNNFDDFEGQLNLDDEKFYFKTDRNGKAVVLQQKDLQQVTVDDNGHLKSFRLLNIKSVGKNRQIVDLNRKAWLPLLLKEGNFGLYGFNMYINNRYVHTYVYISGDDINALKPTDRTFAGRETMIDSYRIMLKHVFNDCKALDEPIEDFLNPEKWKLERKNVDARIKLVNKDKTLNDAQQRGAIQSLNQAFATDPYLKLMQEYGKSCMQH